jgi:BASS family bile acid:Na+ symporter
MGLRDFVLLVVIFGSMAAAVFFPVLGTAFQPYILHLMMFFLFLSFLKIDFRALLDTSLQATVHLALLASIKLIALPAVLYGVTLLIMPDYAVPVLLLSGISTGVVAPFIATLLDAKMTDVLRMVIVSSILVPFSLPALVKLLAGTEITIPLETMVQLLSMVIFVPMIAVVGMRRFWPGLPGKIAAVQFPVSLVLFAIINLGVFSKYSSFFFGHPGQLVISTGLASVLSAIYYLTGFAITPRHSLSERLAAAVSLAIINNVLVIVFSSKFFGPLCPILAAMYMIPFFALIVPVRVVANRRSARYESKQDER